MVDTTIRNSIDYSTNLGNCTYDNPVFGSVIGESVLGCFGKFDIVRTNSYEHVKFFDINERRWIRIRKIKAAKNGMVVSGSMFRQKLSLSTAIESISPHLITDSCYI